jgi:hypothetical protein
MFIRNGTPQPSGVSRTGPSRAAGNSLRSKIGHGRYQGQFERQARGRRSTPIKAAIRTVALSFRDEYGWARVFVS